jgi:hypothetical protein
MVSRFGANKFKSQRISSRIENTRKERPVTAEKELLCFNLKDFDFQQCPPGQTFKDWEDKGLLSAFMDKLYQLSQRNITDAQQQRMLTIYGDFPKSSYFKIPKYIHGDVQWAVIKDIKGQKGRVAGYISGNVFYVVFFDKDHKFWRMKNKKG